MHAAKQFDPERFRRLFDALGWAKSDPDCSRSHFTKAKEMVPDFDEAEIADVAWRVHAMRVADEKGVLDDWIIRREDQENDIHSAVIDVVGSLPLKIGGYFEPDMLRAAIRERFQAAYGCEA